MVVNNVNRGRQSISGLVAMGQSGSYFQIQSSVTETKRTACAVIQALQTTWNILNFIQTYKAELGRVNPNSALDKISYVSAGPFWVSLGITDATFVIRFAFCLLLWHFIQDHGADSQLTEHPDKSP